MATDNNNRTIEASGVAAVSNPETGTRLMAMSPSGVFTPVTMERLAELVRDSIKVGGRNLLKGTGTPVILKGDGPVHEAYTHVIQGDLTAHGGKPFTISYDYSYDNVTTGPTFTTNRFVVSIAFETATGKVYKEASVFLPVSSSGLSGQGHCKSTFIMPEGASLNNLPTAHIQFVSGNAKLWNVKWEEGNIATAWSPAFEDLSENRGGVKSTFPTRYAFGIPLPVREGGVRHEREDNGTDHGDTHGAAAGHRCKPGVGSFRDRLEYMRRARCLSHSAHGYRELSAGRYLRLTGGASRILHNAHNRPDTKAVDPHSSADKPKHRFLDEMGEARRGISLIVGKEAVAA